MAPRLLSAAVAAFCCPCLCCGSGAAIEVPGAADAGRIVSALPPLRSGLGHASWRIKDLDANRLGQDYFDQGLRLLYGFNFDQAIDAFRAANLLDGGKCSLCLWGEAYAVGRNLNAGMELTSLPAANDALRQAEEILQAERQRGHGGEHHEAAALVAALHQRYAVNPTTYAASQRTLDADYALAMRSVSRAFPENHHIATFFADALMNTMPWDYYEEGRTAVGHTLKPVAAEARQVLEGVLAAEPTHEGAIHLYIHLLEASDDNEQAQPYAEMLAGLAPSASHLVHMPSHTFMHTGGWAAAVRVNHEASYEAGDQIYPLHNREFLVWALRIEGRSLEALNEARALSQLALTCADASQPCEIEGCHPPDPAVPQSRRQ